MGGWGGARKSIIQMHEWSGEGGEAEGKEEWA